MQVELTGFGGEYAKGTDDPEAYLKFIKSAYYFNRFNKEDNAISRKLLEEAIALDPNYTAAFSAVGDTHYADVWNFFSEDYKESIAKVAERSEERL